MSALSKYILKAVETVLLLALPSKESDITSNGTVFQGLLTIKKNKTDIQQAQLEADVEQTTEFQENWRKLSARPDTQ